MLDEVVLGVRVKGIIDEVDENPSREGLKDTPNRVAKYYAEWITKGAPEFKLTDFEAESFDQMIIQKNIPFYSLCEHHMLPFFGSAVVCYIPSKRIIGLSKLARIVQWYARRLQNQERLTCDIANCIQETLSPVGVGVILKARHLCMEMRGIKVPGTETITSKVLGVIEEKDNARREFLSLARS